MNRDDSLISNSQTDVVATASDTEQCLADLGAQSSAASVPSYSETLSRIYAELPDSLKTISQGVSCCPKPFFLPQHSLDSALGIPFSLPVPQALSSPPLHLRRDRNSGHLFIEDSSRFTITQKDLDGVTGLRIHNCRDFVIDLGGAEVQEEFATRPKFFLHFFGCNGFALRNVTARGGRNLGLFECCDRFSAAGITCSGYEGYGLILLHSRSFSIRDCVFDGNLASGILVIGDCQDGTISDCQCTGSTGYYNWDAGLHITHCSRNVTIDDVPERCHEALPIREKVMRPRRIHVLRSTFANNRAQGIYLEGAQECVISGNTLAGNNKEGICFDWGTSACLFIDNIVRENGYRSNMTEFEIRVDFVADFPLMPDQSSTCKLPGIAFDNGVLNAIINNDIRDNFGGGLKMVRTAIGNLIQGNAFSNNSRGENFFVKRVYDLYILSLGNRGGEFDDDRDNLLDFLASSFNVFCGNNFKGAESDAVHYGRECNWFWHNEFERPPQLPRLTPSGGHPQLSQAITTRVSVRPTVSPCPHTLYAFGSVTGKHLGILRLEPSGRIAFAPHPNETHWRIEGEELLFFDRNYNITTRFLPYSRDGRNSAFFGRFHNTALLHYLIPLLSVAERGTRPNLPAVLINTTPMDRDVGLFLEAIFHDLGWAATGLHCRTDQVETRGQVSSLVDSQTNTNNTTGTQHDTLPCPFSKILSILMPGQTVSGHIPPDCIAGIQLNGLVCIFATRDLRTTFLQRFLAEDRSCSEERHAAHAWHHLADPRDRFLIYLETNLKSADTALVSYSGVNRFSTVVHCEDFRQDSAIPPVSLLETLIPLGFSQDQISDAVRHVVSTKIDTVSSAYVDRSQYWSPAAEKLFENSVTGIVNSRLEYELRSK